MVVAAFSAATAYWFLQNQTARTHRLGTPDRELFKVC